MASPNHYQFLMLCCMLALPAAGPASEWPEYRGPSANGHAPAAAPPVTWSESSNVRWKTAIHGKGWSTPVVAGDRIWLTTAREDGKAMFVLCLDRESGKVLFDHRLLDVADPRPLGNHLNSYASPSPVVSDHHVYVHFGSYGTACIDQATRTTRWLRTDLPCNHFRGPASSPILFEDLLIFHMDGSDHHYIVALDAATGETRWRTDRSTDYRDLDKQGKPAGNGDFRKAYNTPLIVQPRETSLLISPSAKAIYAYAPHSGQELWQVRHDGHSTAGRTLYDGRHIYANTGYGQTELLCIDPTGRGDITASHVVWRQRKQVPKRSSAILTNDRIFSCTDAGIASCVDARSGDLVWQHRLGGEFSASVLLAQERLYCFNQEGDCFVLRPADAFQQVAHNQLDDGCMASPVAVGKSLIVRTKSHVYCLADRTAD